jgi:hypothetical protein
MKYAFYKGSGTILDKVIRLWMRGPYAHVEVILEDYGDGTYQIASSVPGTGVRITRSTLPASDWDIIDGPGDVNQIATWFNKHDGDAYDYIGLFTFVMRPVLIEERRKYWCSEAILLAAGFKGAWREDPNSMYNAIRFAQASVTGTALTGCGA